MKKKYFFIDESGDPNFYGKRGKSLVGEDGYQPLLFIGMIATDDRKKLRNSILKLKNEIENDELYNTLHCIKPGWYFHAIEDHPEIRTRFIDFLRNLDGFKSYIVIGRKDINRFYRKHNNNPTEFYFDLVYQVIKDRMNQEDEYYQIYLAKLQKTKMDNFTDAVSRAIERDNINRREPIVINYQCDIVLSSQYPELSIIDYLLWVLQRYIIKGEQRFYNVLRDKYNLIIDLYDTENYSTKRKGRSNYYSRKNPFELEKATKFEV